MQLLRDKMNKQCKCGNEIKRYGAKRCRVCYLNNPDKGYSHNYSKRELLKRAKRMTEGRISGKIKTWNKNKSLWRERPELVLKMKATQIKNNLYPKNGFKKGHSKSMKHRKNLINRHHKDLNNRNNHPDNLLYLNNSSHNSLHKRAYDYLVSIGKIEPFLNWFNDKFKPKYYNNSQYIFINKKLAKIAKAKEIKNG